jgi:hypothetical protein
MPKVRYSGTSTLIDLNRIFKRLLLDGLLALIELRAGFFVCWLDLAGCAEVDTGRLELPKRQLCCAAPKIAFDI